MLLSFVFDFKGCQTHKDIHNPYSVIIALILFFRTLLEVLYWDLLYMYWDLLQNEYVK